MQFKLTWLNSRKGLIYSFFIDSALFSLLFFEIFNTSISSKSILIILTLLNTIIWTTSSYIIGRYTNYQVKKNFDIFINHFIKTFLIIISSLFLNQVLFKLFWNWDYMNFESFSDFLNN